MNGAPFTARATIEFPEEGRIAGDGPCNRYVATQTVPYPWFSLTAIGATKRGCDDLAAETAFFTTLAAMTIAEVIGPVVKLRNLDGQSLVFDASADAAD
jgi:heat shock protein HslJ